MKRAKDAVLVIFSRNKDRKTVNMFVDGFLISDEIPFIPSKAVDHRGSALWFYAQENGLSWPDFQLDEFTEQPSEVERGFMYMFKTDLIAKEIAISNQQRKFLV
jgi:hypothetical protein